MCVCVRGAHVRARANSLGDLLCTIRTVTGLDGATAPLLIYSGEIPAPETRPGARTAYLERRARSQNDPFHRRSQTSRRVFFSLIIIFI